MRSGSSTTARAAGAGTDTLAGARGLYVPLRGIQTIVGVLGIRPAEAKALQDPEQVQLVSTPSRPRSEARWKAPA